LTPSQKFRHILSYLFPIKIRKGSSTVNSVLELFLYRGEYQLATEDAIYSDGTRYRPLLSAFTQIRQERHQISQVLILGAGLGSGAAILYKLGFTPRIVMVDIDPTVIQWAEELMHDDIKNNVSFVCDDASLFIEKDVHTYDLLVVDIFKGRKVPDFVLREEFLHLCRNRLHKGGSVVFNYMIETNDQWQYLKKRVETAFSSVTITTIGINRVIVARV
jgi:spermidine synthase